MLICSKDIYMAQIKQKKYGLKLNFTLAQIWEDFYLCPTHLIMKNTIEKKHVLYVCDPGSQSYFWLGLLDIT